MTPFVLYSLLSQLYPRGCWEVPGVSWVLAATQSLSLPHLFLRAKTAPYPSTPASRTPVSMAAPATSVRTTEMGSGKSSALTFPLLQELPRQTPYGNDVSAGCISTPCPVQEEAEASKDKLAPESQSTGIGASSPFSLNGKIPWPICLPATFGHVVSQLWPQQKQITGRVLPQHIGWALAPHNKDETLVPDRLWATSKPKLHIIKLSKALQPGAAVWSGEKLYRERSWPVHRPTEPAPTNQDS